jgi:cyanophycinase-like exopeptidase
MKIISLILSVFIVCNVFAQSYTSYFTGSTNDITTSPTGGVCMMGGASEHDEAMKWFLNRADGGDVLVLRASGSDGYNNYMYSSLGVNLNSVETIVFNNATAANDNYIKDKINKAEAIWFAGGNQWDYISYWRNTAIDSLINIALLERDIVIGGTSAGMAILGKYYFSAENGTVTSSAALSNPFNFSMKVDSTTFLKNNYLGDVITDSHYDSPNRKGRHVAFLARIFVDYNTEAKGIACNEYTAVCVDNNGLAKVYGDYPSYDEDAYFIQLNCELSDIDKQPESCVVNTPLTWSIGEQVIKVYKVHGTNSGLNTFNMATWESGSGGEWQTWYVENGVLYQNENTNEPICSVSANNSLKLNNLNIYPNPIAEYVRITANQELIKDIKIIDLKGNIVYQSLEVLNVFNYSINLSYLNSGIYIVKIESDNEITFQKLIKE